MCFLKPQFCTKSVLHNHIIKMSASVSELCGTFDGQIQAATETIDKKISDSVEIVRSATQWGHLWTRRRKLKKSGQVFNSRSAKQSGKPWRSKTKWHPDLRLKKQLKMGSSSQAWMSLESTKKWREMSLWWFTTSFIKWEVPRITLMSSPSIRSLRRKIQPTAPSSTSSRPTTKTMLLPKSGWCCLVRSMLR